MERNGQFAEYEKKHMRAVDLVMDLETSIAEGDMTGAFGLCVQLQQLIGEVKLCEEILWNDSDF